MRLFTTLFYLHVHLTLLNLYLFLPQKIQKYVPGSKLLAKLRAIINLILSILILNLTASTLACTNCSAWAAYSQAAPHISLETQGIISFASPPSDTFCFSVPHPSPSHIH